MPRLLVGTRIVKSKLTAAEALRVLRQQLAASLERIMSAQGTVQSGATHSEAKQEHPKDTRSTEASYLARGLAERVETMQDAVNTLAVFRPRPRDDDDPISLGDLVALAHDDGRETIHFLAPVGGGEKLMIGKKEVLVLTARAPLGAALIGKQAGDEVELDLPGGKRILEISWVR